MSCTVHFDRDWGYTDLHRNIYNIKNKHSNLPFYVRLWSLRWSPLKASSDLLAVVLAGGCEWWQSAVRWCKILLVAAEMPLIGSPAASSPVHHMRNNICFWCLSLFTFICHLTLLTEVFKNASMQWFSAVWPINVVLNIAAVGINRIQYDFNSLTYNTHLST